MSLGIGFSEQRVFRTSRNRKAFTTLPNALRPAPSSPIPEELMRISGVIHTFNEENNIANAIRSLLAWVDEVVVIDMFSEDKTRQIAESLGARVVLHERLAFADPAREFGISQTRGEWIMALDADEMVPATLGTRLTQIAEGDEADIVMIYFHDFMMGASFSGGGWGLHHEFHPRFFRKGKVQFPPYVHARHSMMEGARIMKLSPVQELAIVHFNYIDASHVLRKFNRYTTVEAEGRHVQGLKASMSDSIKAACRAFVARYIYRRGYREGWRGLFMCTLMVMYEIAALAKHKEIEDQEANGPIEARYARIAEEVLRQYGSEAENNAYKSPIRGNV
jgi:glycosyltransferase involved in cell wall biosynthesis